MDRSLGGFGRAVQLFVGFTWFGGALLYGQAASFPPTISQLDAYLNPSTVNPGGPAVTAQASQAPTDFTLQITGTNVTLAAVVGWVNNTTGTTTNFSGTALAVTPTTIRLQIPAALYTAAASITVRVTIGTFPPPTAPFTVNPPLVAAPSTLPSAATNVPYSQPLFTGGTSPYFIG